LHRGPIVGAIHFGQGSYDCRGADKLHLYVIQRNSAYYEASVAHSVQLLGLGDDHSIHRDAYIVIRQQLVHGVHVGIQLREPPGFLKFLYLVFVLVIPLRMGTIGVCSQGGESHAHDYASHQQDAGTNSTKLG